MKATNIISLNEYMEAGSEVPNDVDEPKNTPIGRVLFPLVMTDREWQ